MSSSDSDWTAASPSSPAGPSTGSPSTDRTQARGGRVRTVLITDEVAAGVADAVAFAREHGIDEIGIRGVGEENVVALDDAAITALRLEVSELGVRVASVLSPLYKAYLPGRAGPALDDPNVPSFSLDGAFHLALRHRLPELGVRFGAECVRVFSFLTEPGLDVGHRDEARDLMTNLELSYPGVFAVENEDVCFIQTVEDLDRCTAETGLRGILDPANDWYVTREPVAPRISEALVDRLADVHIKDHGRRRLRALRRGRGRLAGDPRAPGRARLHRDAHPRAAHQARPRRRRAARSRRSGGSRIDSSTPAGRGLAATAGGRACRCG